MYARRRAAGCRLTPRWGAVSLLHLFNLSWQYSFNDANKLAPHCSIGRFTSFAAISTSSSTLARAIILVIHSDYRRLCDHHGRARSCEPRDARGDAGYGVRGEQLWPVWSSAATKKKCIGLLIGCLVAQCPKFGICSVGVFRAALELRRALPNEGASNRLEWAECYVRSDSARALVPSVSALLVMHSG